jgi:hypothetical protein
MDSPAASAAKVLGSKGKKLHAHGMHIRRTENGYVAKHELRDAKGHPPTDGQSSEAEYNIANPAELAAHVQQHMGPVEPDDAQEEMNSMAGQ